MCDVVRLGGVELGENHVLASRHDQRWRRLWPSLTFLEAKLLVLPPLLHESGHFGLFGGNLDLRSDDGGALVSYSLLGALSWELGVSERDQWMAVGGGCGVQTFVATMMVGAMSATRQWCGSRLFFGMSRVLPRFICC